MALVSGLQSLMTVLDELFSLAKMDSGGGHQAQRRMAMVGVVPLEKGLAPTVGMVDRSKAVGVIGAVLDGFELSFGVRIVGGGVWSGMALGNPQIEQ